MTAAVAVEGVAKVYGGPVPVVALDGVDAEIDAGECVALMGASGSGKSTLLHLMGTLERPTRGAIRLLGEDVSHMTDRALSGLRAHRLGFVFQQFFLLEHVTALENVAQGLLYRGGTAASARRQAAADALERVGMGHRLDHRPPELSGGERQRVAIARAVVGRPAVVLADEPTGNLDSANGKRIVDLLRSLAADGTALVVATHDPGVAAAMDRQVDLLDGQVVNGAGAAR